MNKKLVNRTCELYFQDKLSLPRKFFQNPARVLIPEPKARRAVQGVSPWQILLIPFSDSEVQSRCSW